MPSSSSTDAGSAPFPPDLKIADFRVERAIGRGRRGVVYEATQLSLDRRVALKLLPPDPELAERFRRFHWPEHPHAVRMYAAGAYPAGHFVAMQLVPGPTLAKLQSEAPLEPTRALEILNEVATALDAAHREGIVHGAVEAQNVLIDGQGRALLSDFGLAFGTATPDSDRATFAALVRECLGENVPAPAHSPSSAADVMRAAASGLPRDALPERRVARRTRRAIAPAIGALVVAVAVVVILAGSGKEPERAPPISPGSQALGSALSSAGVSSVDCNGRPPTGASLSCTIVQTRLSGDRLVAPRGGVVRRWAVRGARGDLALQVIRRRGEQFDAIARTPYQAVPDEGVHLLPANLSIHAGDLVGVAVTPGAAVGVRKDVRGAATARWFGPLSLALRSLERGKGSGFDHELLLRVEWAPGAEWRLPGRLTGRAAALAPAGHEIGTRTVDLPGGTVRRVVAVRLGDRVAVDLFTGERRRLGRLVVANADPRGALVNLTLYRRPIVLLEWRNPDGRTISHDYAVGADSIVPRS